MEAFERDCHIAQRSASPDIHPRSAQLANTTHSQLQELEASPLRSVSKVFVVLPAYNEEVALGRLLQKVRSSFTNQDGYEVIVVDDASTDETRFIATEASLAMPVHVVSHETNQGLSGAIKSGLEAAMEIAQDGDVIVTMDADDTHNPNGIAGMLRMINDGHDIVIASRYQKGSKTIGVPKNRLLMTFFARWLFKFILPIKGVRDYTCGYRAYRFSALDKAMNHHKENFFTEKGFSCMVDILLKMRQFDFVIGEVPMILRYDNKPTESKMDVVSTAQKTIALLVRRRLGW